MADTDSALKTQMFMSESARQNAVDLSARISAGFQAAGEAVRFEGEVSRSMVQSAAQFKQIQMDEYFKKEQLKMETKRLALAEQAQKDRLEYNNKQLELRAKAQEGIVKKREEDKEKDAEYGEFVGNVVVEAGKYASDLDTIKSSLAQNDETRLQFKSRLDYLQQNRYTMPEDEYLKQVNSTYQNIESTLESDRSLRAREGELESKITTLKSFADAARLKAPIDTLYQSFYDFTKPEINLTTTPEVDQFLKNSGPGVGIISQSKASPPNISITNDGPFAQQPVWKLNDMESRIFNTEFKFDALQAKRIKSVLPESDIASINEKVKAIESVSVDSLLSVSPDQWDDKEKKLEKAITIIDRWKDTNSEGTLQEQVFGGSYNIRDKAQKVIDKAKDLYFVENKNKERATFTPPFDDLRPYIDKAKSIVYNSGTPSTSGVPTAPTAPGVNKDEVNAALGAATQGTNSNIASKEVAINNYVQMLGGDTLDADAMGQEFNEVINKKANVLFDFNKNKQQFLGMDDRELAKSLAALPDDILDVNRTISSAGFGPPGRVGLYASKDQAVKSIISKGRDYAAEFLAEVELSKKKELGLYREAKRDIEPRL